MDCYIWRNEHQKQWVRTKKHAIELKNELLRHFNYAFHHHTQIKKRLASIRRRNSNNDLIHNLGVLASIAEKHSEVLKTISFDERQIIEAKKFADIMPELLANAKLTDGEQRNARCLRDKTYTVLAERIKEIRACGHYIHHKNKEEYMRYNSDYNARHNKLSKIRNKDNG